MSLRVIWQYMDRSVTKKILYGPQKLRSILLYYTQYMQICQTTCFCYCISKTKNEFRQNPEENIILIGPGPYTKILTDCANKDIHSKKKVVNIVENSSHYIKQQLINQSINNNKWLTMGLRKPSAILGFNEGTT
jgi:hypothetical protein